MHLPNILLVLLQMLDQRNDDGAPEENHGALRLGVFRGGKGG